MSDLNPCQVRLARPNDARQINRLYEDAYRPSSGGSARDNYPFPQFLDPDWVARAVVNPNICWVIAEAKGQVIGSAGSLRNIGTAEDQVAEVFGIVIAPEARQRGLGSRLLKYLRFELEKSAGFIICESRTALAAGWKVAKATGFLPVGFEPFAHTTPAGAEPMLLTAFVAQDALKSRCCPPPTTESVSSLRAAALDGLLRQHRQGVLARESIPSTSRREYSQSLMAGEVCRDDLNGSSFLRRIGDDRPHGCGVIGLRRLEGEDWRGSRYERRFYVFSCGAQTVAAARIVIDWTDRRARVLDYQSTLPGLHQKFFGGVLVHLESEDIGNVTSIVVDTRADRPETHSAFEAIGFRPTVYYPAFVQENGVRIDAVQFTKIVGKTIEQGLACMAPLTWPAGEKICAVVIPSFAETKRVAIGTNCCV